MSYIDTHAHLDAAEFDADRPKVIHRAREAGIDAFVCPGITADSSEVLVGLAQTRDDVFAAVGIQPNYCAEAAVADWDRITRLADHPRVVAIGETGLDRHWDFTPFEVQQDFFERHLRLAARRDLPLVIHCREAQDDLVPMLRKAAARAPLRGVLHAFSGGPSMARQCLDLGLYVSFAGAVTYKNRKFDPLREAAVLVPDNRLLIETDSPYMVPTPLRGKQKRNEPANIVYTAGRLAEIREQDPDELARQTAANARRLFRLE